MLKILARRDRHTAHTRDATDLRFLMSRYADAGNYDRLYDGDALDLLEAHGFDPDVAGAALLARDMAALVAPAIRPLMLEALAPGEAYPLLLNQMLGGGHRMLQLAGERPGAIEACSTHFERRSSECSRLESEWRGRSSVCTEVRAIVRRWPGVVRHGQP
jgi:hypothetical protein